MVMRERPLNEAEFELYRPFFQPRTLDLVRIVEGSVPFWLRTCMSAVVLGHRIFLRSELGRPRAYQVNSAAGIELLAHELTHVEQFLSGMTILKYLWASRHGYRNNPYEVEAYAKAAAVKARILSRLQSGINA